jgi:hypothetical protein
VWSSTFLLLQKKVAKKRDRNHDGMGCGGNSIERLYYCTARQWGLDLLWFDRVFVVVLCDRVFAVVLPDRVLLIVWSSTFFASPKKVAKKRDRNHDGMGCGGNSIERLYYCTARQWGLDLYGLLMFLGSCFCDCVA